MKIDDPMGMRGNVAPRPAWAWVWVCVWWAAGAIAVSAQPVAQGAAGLNPVLPLLFKNVAGFSATADVRIQYDGPNEVLRMPMAFHYRAGWSRSQISMAQVQSRALTQDMVVSLREVGMDEVVTIAGPVGATNLVLYPQIKAWFDAGPAYQSHALSVDAASWTREKIGEEPIDGHACHRYRLALKAEGNAGPREVLVWEAQDMDGFPIQIQIQQDGFKTQLFVRYHGIKRDVPGLDLFLVPPTYKRFESMEKVMEAAVNRLVGSGDR